MTLSLELLKGILKVNILRTVDSATGKCSLDTLQSACL